MCNCKQTPLDKVERYLRANGWARISGSQMQVIDEFIFNTIGLRPTTNEDRPDLYGSAKSQQKK